MLGSEVCEKQISNWSENLARQGLRGLAGIADDLDGVVAQRTMMRSMSLRLGQIHPPVAMLAVIYRSVRPKIIVGSNLCLNAQSMMGEDFAVRSKDFNVSRSSASLLRWIMFGPSLGA